MASRKVDWGGDASRKGDGRREGGGELVRESVGLLEGEGRGWGIPGGD